MTDRVAGIVALGFVGAVIILAGYFAYALVREIRNGEQSAAFTGVVLVFFTVFQVLIHWTGKFLDWMGS